MAAWLDIAASVLALAAVLRLSFLFLFRRAVIARVVGADLNEAERLADADNYQYASPAQLTTADVPVRNVLVRVAYEINGIEHRTDVTLPTAKGSLPDVLTTIWVSPHDPHRATAFGPFWVTPVLVVAGACAVTASRLPF